MPGLGPHRASHASALEACQPAGGGGDWSPTLPLTLPLALAQTFFTALLQHWRPAARQCHSCSLPPLSIPAPSLLHPRAHSTRHLGPSGCEGGWVDGWKPQPCFTLFSAQDSSMHCGQGRRGGATATRCISRPVVHITHSQWQLAPCSQPTLLRYPFLHTICLAKHRPWPH